MSDIEYIAEDLSNESIESIDYFTSDEERTLYDCDLANSCLKKCGKCNKICEIFCSMDKLQGYLFLCDPCQKEEDLWNYESLCWRHREAYCDECYTTGKKYDSVIVFE